MMGGNRSVTSLLASTASELSSVSSSARLDVELLLAHASRLTRAQLLSRGAEPVAEEAAETFRQLVARRGRGEPLAYILGTKEFWSLTLEVDERVLVPRPETELLVELALAVGDALDPVAGVRVIDLGTGSGAIALAIATERPSWKVTATDRSTAALEVARRNAARHELGRVELVAGDWLAPLAGRMFDVIVSNPPYLAADDPALGDATLSFEPRDALTDNADGLKCLRRIADEAREHLAEGGALIFEHAAAQAEALRAELVARGYRHVRSHRDLAGHERATEARNPRPEGRGKHGSLSNIAR